MGNMNCGYSLLEKDSRKPGRISESETKDQSDEGTQKVGGLVCAWCGDIITSRESAIEVNSSHDHTFANPGGHVFHIGCFRIAPGCVVDPVKSSDFTWFQGYAWSAAVCSRCRSHLGWHFRSEADDFFGLILARLVEKGPVTD